MPLCTVLLRFPFIEMSWKDAQDSGGRQRAMMGHFFFYLRSMAHLSAVETQYFF